MLRRTHLVTAAPRHRLGCRNPKKISHLSSEDAFIPPDSCQSTQPTPVQADAQTNSPRNSGAYFKMRFAFISTMHDWPWGGSEELWSQTAIRLKQSRHQVYASVGFRPHLPSQILGLMEQGIQVKLHASHWAGVPLRIWNRVSRFDQRCHAALRRFRPDLVVISQGFNKGGFNWAQTCREARIPYVIIVHCNSELWWFPEQDVGDAVASYNTASRVFCVSQANLDLLRLQLGEPLLNAELLWNPYNVSSKRTPAWPDESGGWRLACVARMDPQPKGRICC